MSDEKRDTKDEQSPDLVRNYRPVAIRSVVAAYAMLPKVKTDPDLESDDVGVGFPLPAGFHSPAED